MVSINAYVVASASVGAIDASSVSSVPCPSASKFKCACDGPNTASILQRFCGASAAPCPPCHRGWIRTMDGTMRSCRGWGLLAVVAILELMLSRCRQQFLWAKAPVVFTFLCFLFVCSSFHSASLTVVFGCGVTITPLSHC